MSRDDGFAIADVDVAYLDDPKVRRLVRSTRDEGLVARCLVAHTAVILASWRTGERVTLEDAAPIWLTGLEDIVARLVEAELLEADGRIPEHAWTAWHDVAAERREKTRDRWRRWRDRQASTDKRVINAAQTFANGGQTRNRPSPSQPTNQSPSLSARSGARSTENVDVV